MRKAFALALILTVLAAIAYFTKPSEEACIKKAQQEFEEKKLSYTGQTLPAGINPEVFKETAEKNFLESLQVSDRFILREISTLSGSKKERIGWAAFGYVSVTIK